MSAHPHSLSPEEYLTLDREAEIRSEYYNGQMYAMSGASHPHGIVAHNISFLLELALADRPFLVTTHDLRVRVHPGGLYAYPDIVVVCGSPQYADDQADTLLNPLLLFEVLSPSTERYDRGFKSAQYRTIASLQEHVLVSQSEPRIEVYRRQPAGNWLFSEWIGLEATCRLDSLECGLPLSAVYKNAGFPANESDELR
jgi:Uma2 family endonuclease